MKRAFRVKKKAFFIIFKGLSVAKNCPRPESAAYFSVYIILGIYAKRLPKCARVSKQKLM